jgi:hypothetical protein
VAEIEREKDAGEFYLVLDSSYNVDVDDFCRGGKETLKAGGHCCWTGSYGFTISGRDSWTVVLFCVLQSSFVNEHSCFVVNW